MEAFVSYPILKMNPPKYIALIILIALSLALWFAWPSSNPPADADTAVPVEQDQEALKQIDHLLINDSLEHSEVARRLSAIAAQPSLSTEVRGEALGHGVLLDIEAFSGLAGDPGLPEELAMELLGQTINYNENPSFQIKTYRELMIHPSQEVRELAIEMLRFMVEDDIEEADQATLLRMAEAKLSALSQETGQTE